MNITTNEKENSKVAVVTSDEPVISTVQDALDLMATLKTEYECSKVVIDKSLITERFFELRTGLAGEILQKYTNYNMKIAIVGDFSVYDSKSLRYFIYESNRGNQNFFLPTAEEAVEKLHSLK